MNTLQAQFLLAEKLHKATRWKGPVNLKQAEALVLLQCLENARAALEDQARAAAGLAWDRLMVRGTDSAKAMLAGRPRREYVEQEWKKYLTPQAAEYLSDIDVTV